MDSVKTQVDTEKSIIARTRKPKIAGLIILGMGILSLIAFIVLVVALAMSENQQDLGMGVFILFYVCVPMVIFAIINISGGIYILKRKKWMFALITPVLDVLVNIAVLAYFNIVLFGYFFGFGIDIIVTTTVAIGLLLAITCLILVILSKEEFV